VPESAEGCVSNIKVHKFDEAAKDVASVLENVEKRMDAVRRRAYELSERRRQGLDYATDDWLKAERDVFGWPAAEVSEKGADYEIQITLPGFEAKEVQVVAAPAAVMVHAATASQKKKEQRTVIWTEFGSNDVYRRIELPGSVNPDKVTAQLDRGILRIKAAKSAGVKQPKPRKIAVATA
jgi:HSP20 family protein